MFCETNSNVSEVVLYTKCPRKIYFTSRNEVISNEIEKPYIRHLLLKELALSCAEIAVSKQEILPLLQKRVEEIVQEIITIYSDELEHIDENQFKDALEDVYEVLPAIAGNLKNQFDEEMIELIKPVEIEPLMHSDKLNLSGAPSAIICSDKQKIPMLIKTGNAPMQGVWKNDRIPLAAYSILTEERYDQPVNSAVLFYASQGQARSVRIRPAERREVLNILKRIEKIKEGKMPQAKRGKLCGYCPYEQMCQSQGDSLASKFF
ncbi:CRISPR-associated protein Cas4 [Methanohalophilus mahii]|nr:CRISPR-associated protein Cas4 [Methanohalophilus mahii]